MFTINHRGENLSVLFKKDFIIRLGKKGFENVEQIACAIVGEGARVKASGMALRSEIDNANDAVGMRLSLGRALQKLVPLPSAGTFERSLAKDVRAQFWKAFDRAVNAELAADEPEPVIQGFAGNRVDAAPPFVETPETERIQFDPAPVVENPRIAKLEKYLQNAVSDHERFKSSTETCRPCQEWQKELADLKAA